VARPLTAHPCAHNRTEHVSDPQNRLVIVESPAKAKTIAGFLGRGWTVESSYGHVRDLPAGAKEIPPSKKERFSDPIGVDVDGGFVPLYRVSASAKPRIKKLKEALKSADELYLATDEDREGESIAWHLREELKPTVPVRRMVFHEITREAIDRALGDVREIDEDLVEAQETRRILDRLYGYPVSEVLWRKVARGLSAGRVQSVATRLLVQRERERIAFESAAYWDVVATLATQEAPPATFESRLVAVDGEKVATSKDFTSVGELKQASKARVLDETLATEIAARLGDQAQVAVRSVEAKPYRRKPSAPFRTTTLQQDASRKLGYTATRTMQVAQRLYEGGYITYMRTDSTTLSDTAMSAARAQVLALYGEDYLEPQPRVYRSKVKNAQEAHEAIRPAGESFRTPAETGLTGDEFRLYELVWMRTVASQMRDAVGQTVSLLIDATLPPGGAVEVATLSSSGTVITFPGFRKAYVEGRDDADSESDTERRLPALEQGQPLDVRGSRPDGHDTKPPARYTEATLVRELEEREIGRPSTYASIIRTVLDRGYAYKRGTALVPSWVAFATTRLLEEHFTALVDYDFTARMEDELDKVAQGGSARTDVLSEFWSGGGSFTGLNPLVLAAATGIDARAMSTFPLDGGSAGGGVDVRVGRYGTYVEDAEGQRGDVPDDLPPDELTIDKARELIDAKATGDRRLGEHPDSGLPIEVKVGRYGPYVTEVLPDDAPKKAKPKRASLLKSMDPATVTLEQATLLLSLPREVGQFNGEPITAQNGRFGPYIKAGGETRSLPDEDSLQTLTEEQAVELLKQPKQRGRRGAAGRELGADPATGETVEVRSGRYGPYVKAGKVNATIPKAEDPEQITIERAAELLAAKRS
jgi:DNA topoisomerase-1